MNRAIYMVCVILMTLGVILLLVGLWLYDTNDTDIIEWYVWFLLIIGPFIFLIGSMLYMFDPQPHKIPKSKIKWVVCFEEAE